MERYENNKNGKIAIIISDRATGMCCKTIGITLVIYKYEGDTYDYPFVMKSQEFHKEHTKTK
jgi:hypothetical protein